MDSLDFLEHVYGIFGFTFELNLSTRPESRLGSDELWDAAEAALENARLENQKYIATINNLTKIMLSDKKIEGDVLSMLIQGIHQKEIKQIEQEGGDSERTDS